MYFHHQLYREDIAYLTQLPIDWTRVDGKTFFITGASGLIGTVLVDTLMERNRRENACIKIYAVGRSLERAQERFGAYMHRPEFEFIQADINLGIDLQERADYVLHCASNTHPRAYAEDPIGTILTNVLGTRYVLQYAAENHCERVLFLSSVEIYGENFGEAPFREEDCGFIDCNTLRAGYPEGKRVGEALCQAYRVQYGVDVVIPRICRVYGPTMLSSDSKALAQFLRNAVKREDIVLKSEGMQYFSYCYAVDAAAALLYLLLYGENGEAYNVADEGSNIRLRDLAQMLAELAGTRVIFALPDAVEQAGFSKAATAVLHAEKLKRLHWQSRYPLSEGLRRTIDILERG
mgnify:FL=1